MKKILTLLLTTGLVHEINGTELNSISLITPISYQRPSSFSQTMKSKLKTGAADLLNIDIAKKVNEKIDPYKKDLNEYYPAAGELDKFISSVVNQGISKHLRPLTDDNLITFYGYLGNQLIGNFADRVLEKEGVSDPKRRALWVKKLTHPFNDCITTSLNSQYDASHCIDALAASLVPSAGIGIVFELSKANLNESLPENHRSSFNREQAELYKSCLSKTKASSIDVKNCALNSMKSGVQKVTNISLSKTLAEKTSTKANGEMIKNTVWPNFDLCTQKVGNNPTDKTNYTAQFMSCIDELIQITGTFLVQDKISSTPAVKEVLSDLEVKKLAREKSETFKKCAQDQKSKGMRVQGMLDVSRCENIITNEVTYLVVSETLRNTAKNSLKSDQNSANKIGSEGIKLLDGCWSNQQTSLAREACLKKTIVKFSQNLASLKLNEAIPSAMPNKGVFTSTSVKELATCLDKTLPANISESNNLNQHLDKCTGKLTRDVALKVADYQIRDSAKGNLSDAETDLLITELVKDDFAKCIGDIPTDEKIEKCSDALTAKAAKHIAGISFSKEVYGYLEKAGGLKHLGLSQNQVDQFLNELNASNRQCVDKKGNSPVIDQVNSCIKESVKKIALYFGDIQFAKSVGNMYDRRLDEKTKIEDQFKKNLSLCLDEKKAPSFSISDYTQNLYACSDKIASTTTLTVGRDQIVHSLGQYLSDRPGVNLAEKRQSLRTKLLGNFETCMSRPEKSGQCIDQLKRDATQSIVINYGRIETKTQLNADITPPMLKQVEDEFILCTDQDLSGDALSNHLDECTKNFALNFAKELGTLKLNYLLKQTLGSDEFIAQKKNIDEAISRYHSCLIELKKIGMNDGLTDKLTICTDGLTNRGLAIVRNSLNEWMSSDQKDAATLMLKREFSNFLPCLSALLPASPFSPQLETNIDSSIKPIAILIAHYIEYNPENAKQTLSGIIQKLSVDINDIAQTEKAKRELLDFLYTSGALDEFIKAVVRGNVKDSLVSISDKDVPEELREIMTSKSTFEEVFNTSEGKRIKDLVMEKILKPALLENTGTSGIAFNTNMEMVKDNVVKLLVNSPSFGEKAIKMGIQKQINEMNGFTKFFAKALYGGDALVWEKVRQTEEGKKAEAYIREYVLMPKFKGIPQSEEEIKRINQEAEKLVTKAVKSYG